MKKKIFITSLVLIGVLFIFLDFKLAYKPYSYIFLDKYKYLIIIFLYIIPYFIKKMIIKDFNYQIPIIIFMTIFVIEHVIFYINKIFALY